MAFQETEVELLRCALSWDANARIVGNVTAKELARVVAQVIHTCPSCGSTAWVNIDCATCNVCSELLREENAQ